MYCHTLRYLLMNHTNLYYASDTTTAWEKVIRYAQQFQRAYPAGPSSVFPVACAREQRMCAHYSYA